MGIKERYAEMVNKKGARLATLLSDSLIKIMQNRDNVREKYVQLREVVDEIGQVVVPYTPCKKGCNYCCHMATAITETEARVIGKYTQRQPITPKEPDIEPEALRAYREHQVKKYMRVPCTFLGEHGECTIYPVRPFACRANHSLEDTAEPCNLTIEGAPVGQLNLKNFHLACAKTFIHESFADIREFFPAKEKGDASHL